MKVSVRGPCYFSRSFCKCLWLRMLRGSYDTIKIIVVRNDALLSARVSGDWRMAKEV